MDRSDPEAWEQLDPNTRRVLSGFNQRYHHFARVVVRTLVLLFVLSAGVGLLSAYLLTQNSERAEENAGQAVEARIQAYDASYASCVSGGDLRILVAYGLDALRRGAVPGDAAPRHLLVQFYARTQAPIDEVLTTAAYESDSSRKYHARTYLGEVTEAVQAEVRTLARQRCERRTREQFPGVPPVDER